jgi:hypothetical protein
MPDRPSPPEAVDGGSLVTAWQPFTFGGVSAFAPASWGRLWRTELVFALLATGSLLWFLVATWIPTIQQAIDHLPDQGGIYSGHLLWEGTEAVTLSSGPFLTIGVNPEGVEPMEAATDILWLFTPRGIIVKSTLGTMAVDYPSELSVDLNRAEWQPWWGAWRPAVLAGTGLLLIPVFFLSWTTIALVYAPGVRLWSWILKRQTTGWGSWRLATAALLPGAVLMSFGLIVYSQRRLGLIGLLLVFGLHWIVGWVYLVLSPAWLPRKLRASRKGNPFGHRPAASGSGPT